MEKKELLYEGKGKKLFATENPEILISEFKDDLTAFNAQKKGSESGKGFTASDGTRNRKSSNNNKQVERG